MIGFDLDGVLVNDIDYSELTDYSIRNIILPLFQPRGEYVIITGRPYADKVDTLKYVRKHFNKQPIKVFCDNADYRKSWQYKLKILEENKHIDVYIESDFDTVKFLNSNLRHRVRVIHFPTYIEGIIFN